MHAFVKVAINVAPLLPMQTHRYHYEHCMHAFVKVVIHVAPS